MSSLLAFRDHPHRRAGHGSHGSGKNRYGTKGKDLEVLVPEGTQVRTREGELLADLVSSGQRWLAARGGQGGKGNAKFLSNRRRAPAFAEQAEQGEEHWLRLELKLLADVALVGFPNAGKSTLISRISAAKPKIAAYPFTTLEPNLGVVMDEAGADWVVADVPGLIQGASQGVGLGMRFLRHIERARVLLILLDPISELTPAEQLDVLNEELQAYSQELMNRPKLVSVSKADMLADMLFERDSQEFADFVLFSSVTGEGIAQLKRLLSQQVRLARDIADDTQDTQDDTVDHTKHGTQNDGDTQSINTGILDAGIPVHRIRPDGITVEREGSGWRICGRPAERAVALSDMTQPEAMEFALERLEKLGVEKALRRAGVKDGDTVSVGNVAFDYRDDSIYMAEYTPEQVKQAST